jgi:hypothetical protein
VCCLDSRFLTLSSLHLTMLNRQLAKYAWFVRHIVSRCRFDLVSRSPRVLSCMLSLFCRCHCCSTYIYLTHHLQTQLCSNSSHPRSPKTLISTFRMTEIMHCSTLHTQQILDSTISDRMSGHSESIILVDPLMPFELSCLTFFHFVDTFSIHF